MGKGKKFNESFEHEQKNLPKAYNASRRAPSTVEQTEEAFLEPAIREEAGLFELIVYLLNSLPAAVVALMILAFFAIIGTLIPQEPMGAEAMDYISKYGPLKYKIMKSLGFTNIYNTVYFNLLFLWIAVSSVVCSITRLRRTLTLWFRPAFRYTEKFFQAQKEEYQIYENSSDSPEEFGQRLRASGLRTHIRKHEDGTASIYADKGFFRKWAAVVFHFAIIVIFLGGLIGKIWGFEGSIPVPEGETRTLVVDLQAIKNPIARFITSYIKPYEFKLTLKDFSIEYDQHIKEPDFFRQLPENEPALREYYKYYVRDYVSLLQGEYKGKKKEKKVIVNHPLGIGRTLFYQASFAQTGYITVDFDGTEKTYPLSPATAYQVMPDGEFRAVSANSAAPLGSQVLFHPEPQGGVFPVKAGPLFRAGERVGELKPIGLFQLIPAQPNGQRFILLNTEEWFELNVPGHKAKVKMADKVDDVSIFQYKHDPGTAILFTGWILLILGVLATLYTPLVQFHILWEKAKVFCYSTVQGSADKSLGYKIIEKTLSSS